MIKIKLSLKKKKQKDDNLSRFSLENVNNTYKKSVELKSTGTPLEDTNLVLCMDSKGRLYRPTTT